MNRSPLRSQKMYSNKSTPYSTLMSALYHQSPQQPHSCLPQPSDHHQLLMQPAKQPDLQWQLSTLLASHRLAHMELQYHYSGDHQAQSSPEVPSASVVIHQGCKRIAETSHSMDPSTHQPPKKPHKEHSCTYCQSIECSRHWNVSKCTVKVSHLNLT